MRTVPHVTEEYRCDRCETKNTLQEVYLTWKCPSCSCPVSIKIITKDAVLSCNRLHPSELRVSQYVVIGDYTHEILRISEQSSSYSIALEGYKVIEVTDECLLLVVEGAWIDRNA